MECRLKTVNGIDFTCDTCGRTVHCEHRTEPASLHFVCGYKPSVRPQGHRPAHDKSRQSWIVRRIAARTVRSRGGPGTEAKRLFESLQIVPLKGCGCEEFARKMDRWGVAGCRGEHYDEIVARFREYAGKYDWPTKLKAAAILAKRAATCQSALAFRLNPLDPASGLVDEAIRRAEAVASATSL